MPPVRDSNPGDSEMLLIDCDVHQAWESEEELAQYLPDGFKERGITPPGDPGWVNPIAAQGLGRTDAVPDDGSKPGSSYELMEEQLFREFGVDRAVLTGPLTQVRLALHPNVHYAKAAMEAYNDWMVEEWLHQDSRFLGSLMVTPQVPNHAVEEINRIGSHEQIVQVQMPGVEQSPYGHQKYWPIYEAAEKNDLCLAIHTATGSYGVARAPTTCAGLPISYPERHVTTAASMMGNLASIVNEGVFVEYPDLDFVILESGLAWLPHFLWKMDKLWKGVGESTPWLERPPSEYISDHVWFSTQPVEEPEDPSHLEYLFEMINAKENLIFSSDYPHWDNDNPKSIFRRIDKETRQHIFSENARQLYGL